MAMLKTCLDCGTNIEHRATSAKRCVSCAKSNRVVTRKNSDERYSRRGQRISENMLTESHRVCLVCDKPVRHYPEITDARICLKCRLKSLEDMGDIEGVPEYGIAQRSDLIKDGQVREFKAQIRYQEG